MSVLVPNRFLFSFEFPLSYKRSLPKIDGALKGWTAEQLLPRLGEIDDQPEFADVWACWNESGVAVACKVTGKKSPLRCDSKNYWKSDNLRLCIDMRDARKNKRAVTSSPSPSPDPTPPHAQAVTHSPPHPLPPSPLSPLPQPTPPIR